jgi:tetratricopeptide (TPR) repeat protein
MKHQENLKIVAIFFAFVFLLLNTFFSQTISPLYTQLVAENKQSAVIYLQKIRKLPVFDRELEKYKSIYGEGIEEEVFRPELEKNAKIRNLTLALEKNSKSRDILYTLYLFYREKGDEKNAQIYLQQAKEIDPNIVE